MYKEGTTMHEVRRIRDELDAEYASLSVSERTVKNSSSMDIFLERMQQAGKRVEKTEQGYLVH